MFGQDPQNTNAVYLDNYGKGGKTSIRTLNPPGGQSHFSLGWDNNNQAPPQEPQRFGRKRIDPNPPYDPHAFGNVNRKPNQAYNNAGGVHTSVKVSSNPGGRSNIVFGTDNINYDDYRK